MQNPQNLVIIAYVRKLVVLTYRVTAKFPRSEMFALTSQMRRAAISIGSNIAEGCGRSSNPAFRKSLDDAMGEASELQFQCWASADLELGDPTEVEHLTHEVERVKKMLAKLIVAVRNGRKKKGSPEAPLSPKLPTDQPTEVQKPRQPE